MITRIRLVLVVLILIAVAAGGSAAPAVCLALSQPTRASQTLSKLERASAQAVPGVSLMPSQVTVQLPDGFVLDVLVDCGTHADAAAVQVAFDPVYMEAVSVAQGDAAFPEILRASIDPVAGIVYYDAGSLLCHSQGSCPEGVIHLATISFLAKARTFPSKNVGIYGQVTWAGDLIYDGQGSGSTVIITSLVSPLYLPLVLRDWVF